MRRLFAVLLSLTGLLISHTVEAVVQVGDIRMFSNTNLVTDSNLAQGNYKPLVLKIPASEDLPAGTVIGIQSITLAERETGSNDTNRLLDYLSIGGVGDAARVSTNHSVIANAEFGQRRGHTWQFNDVKILVNQAYNLYNLSTANGTSTDHEMGVSLIGSCVCDQVISQSKDSGYCPIYEVKFVVCTEIVAKFGSLTAGASSLGYSVAAHSDSKPGFCVTGDRNWSVADGVSVVFSYSGLSQDGDQTLLSLAFSTDSRTLSKVGILTKDGQLKGLWDGAEYSSTIGSALAETGTLIFTFRSNTSYETRDDGYYGVTVFATDGSELYRNSRLQSTANDTIGHHFDFGSKHDGTLAQSGFSVGKVQILRGVVTADEVPSVVAAFEKTAASEDFFWENGGSPRGWFNSWKGGNAGAKRDVVGTNGVLNVNMVADGWEPYNGLDSKDRYTLAVYGTTDLVAAGEGNHAVLWSFGRVMPNGNVHCLAKNGAGEIELLLIGNSGNIIRTLNAGRVSGYHLFTVVFDRNRGAGLFIDNESGVFDAEFTTPVSSAAGTTCGLQLGTLYGGFTADNLHADSSVMKGTGFVPLALWGSDEAFISQNELVDALAARFPAVITIPHTISYREGKRLYLPSITIPDGFALCVQSGTLVVPASVEATLAALEFGDTDYYAENLFGMELDGTINIVNNAVFTSLDEQTAYDKCNDGQGIDFGEWKGIGTFVIRGRLVAETTVMTIIHDAQAVTVTIDGGELSVRGIAAKKAAATINLTNDGALTIGDLGCSPLVTVNSETIARVNGTNYKNLSAALAAAGNGGTVTLLTDYAAVAEQLAELNATLAPIDGAEHVYTVALTMAEGVALRLSEIMPKPTDDSEAASTLARMDPNGLESGWVELENTGDAWVNLADYKFIRVNRSKATSKGDYGNFPSVLVPPRARFVFWTSERYANSADMTVSAFATPDPDGVHPKYYAEYDMLIWPDKMNPKKSPFVRLIYAPDGVETEIIDTVVVPTDIPEGHSIIVDPVVEGRATTRWMTATPTRGTDNTTEGLVALGPNAGPLYEIKGGKKHDSANEFARLAPPAVSGKDYTVTVSMNPTMHPTVAAGFRAEDAITGITLIYRTDLKDSTRKRVAVDLSTKTTDAKDWGDTYTAVIPSADFPEAGHLIQWKFEVTDAAGNIWTTPSFHNKDDGYEWYGTIVEPDTTDVPDTTDRLKTARLSATLPTWHLFADAASLEQMDVDVDAQNLTKVPHNARVAIYDSATSNYYDYVRIDLRGNTSANFTKKSHGLRFAKVHPMTMTDSVTGETIKEIRKTSLISEFADPSRMRQMIAFWLWRKMGNNVPFDFPVRCNLNGAFYQLAFNSERFTDELLEDVYGFDKFGYGYKNVGTLKSGSGTTAGGIEKKTPDDGNEKDISVLQTELRARIQAVQQVSSDTTGASSTGLDNAAVTRFVVEKFNLPAWLNYLASARITQEMDDVWANVSAYYDNPTMKEGVRGTGTWLPLGYDFNLSFGQYFYNDTDKSSWPRSGLMADCDWFKSHPFYGGNRVRCWKNPNKTATCNSGNDGFEAVWQSAKFRRLYLRRLRTLMDQELGAPDADETFETSTTPFIVKMRELLAVMETDAADDLTKWPNNNSDDAIDVWPNATRPQTIEAGVREIYTDYLVPRRQHLYVTHSVTNTARAVGYGTNLNAGIPESQSVIADLKAGISAVYDAHVNAVVIRNTNAETIDLSGWVLGGPVTMTLPAGTVIDQGTDAAPGEVYITADRRATIAALGEAITDQVVVGNGKAGKPDSFVTLTAEDGTPVLVEPEENPGEEVVIPSDAPVYKGTYTEPITITGGAVVFSNAVFEAGVTMDAATTVYLAKDSVSTATAITSSTDPLTVKGSGALTLSGSQTLITAAGLVVDGGVITVDFTEATTTGSCAVLLTAPYIQNGGTVTMNITSEVEKTYGFYCNTKTTEAAVQLNGGRFDSRIAGGKNSATFKLNKGANDAVLNGTAVTVTLAGTAPRFINTDGKIDFTATCGAVTVTTEEGAGTDANVFKSVKKQTLSGGTVSATATGAGSEIFSSDNKIEVAGGVYRLTAADDCFSAATNITVKAGVIQAVSTAGDALDSNGDLQIKGGWVFAFTCSPEHEALDVTPAEENDLEHKLVIQEGAVVVAVGGKSAAPVVDASSTARFMTATGLTMDKKYVLFGGVVEDPVAETRTTTQYAVNWNKKHADTFSLLLAAPGFDSGYDQVKNPSDTDAEFVALDAPIENVFVKTVVEQMLKQVEVAPGGEAVEVAAASAEAAEAAVTVKAEVPAEVAAKVAIDPAVYAGYFKPQATAVAGTDGRFTVVAVLNPDVVLAPVMGATDEQIAPFAVESGAAGATVSIGIVNAKVGLWYGYGVSGDVTARDYPNDLSSFTLATCPDEKLVLRGSPRDGTSAFYRVKVLPVQPKE